MLGGKLKVKLFFALVSISSLGTSSQAQSGDDLIRKMQAAYAGLSSYSQRTSVTGKVVLPDINRITGMTAVFKYSQPNKALITVSSPDAGSLHCFSNGREATVYQSSDNTFARMQVPADLATFVTQLAPYSIAATLDPLYFVEKQDVLKQSSGWTIKAPTKVNGVPVQVVTGQLKGKLLIDGANASATYFLDDKGFIRKMSLEWRGLPMRIPVPDKNGRRTNQFKIIKTDRIITEVVQEMKVNPPLTDADFTYPIPKNARETKYNPARK